MLISKLTTLVMYSLDVVNLAERVMKELPETLTALELSYSSVVMAQYPSGDVNVPTKLPLGLRMLVLPHCAAFEGTSLSDLADLERLHIPRVTSIPTLLPTLTDLHLQHLPNWLHESAHMS